MHARYRLLARVPRSGVLAVSILSLAASVLTTPSARATESGAWVTPFVTPPPRSEHCAVYDAPNERMVIFGGTDTGGARLSDTWALVFCSVVGWLDLSPGGTAPQREGHAAVYDPVRHRMLVFGGRGAGGSATNDTWALSLSGTPSWSQVTTAGAPPAARGDHSMVYDSLRDRVLVYGGSPGGISAYGDVWELTLAGTPTCTELSPTGSAGLRRQHTAIYDPLMDRMVIFSGYVSGNQTRDVWQLSLAGTPAWTEILPSGPLPGNRAQASAVYDSARNRMVIFGGASGASNDAWELTLGPSPAWAQLVPTGPMPARRYSHTAIYEAAHDRMVIFGGRDPETIPIAELGLLQWQGLTGVPDPGAMGTPSSPADGFLSVPRPNPSEVGTAIEFTVERSGPGTIEIFDATGRRVRVIEGGELDAGSHVLAWDGRDETGRPAPMGVYFVRLAGVRGDVAHKVIRMP